MKNIPNFDELKKVNVELKAKVDADATSKIIIRIAMATCSIASGAQQIIDFFIEEMPSQPVEYLIKSTGCTGMCHSEPTVEITLPNALPVMFGEVDINKAVEIVNDYIKCGKQIEGVIHEN